MTTQLARVENQSVRPVSRLVPPLNGSWEFLEAPELDQMSDNLRRTHDLPTEITLTCLWKHKGGQSGGKSTMGKCTKTGGLVAHYAGVDFVIWLAADHCADQKLTDRQIEALLFHELCHAGYDEDTGKPVIVTEDFRGFHAELQTYGLWMPDLEWAASTFEQARLIPLEG